MKWKKGNFNFDSILVMIMEWQWVQTPYSRTIESMIVILKKKMGPYTPGFRFYGRWKNLDPKNHFFPQCILSIFEFLINYRADLNTPPNSSLSCI